MPPPDALEKRSRSGRSRPEPGEGDDEASAFKKVMFYGTGVLIVVVLALFVMKKDIIFAPKKAPPAKAPVKDENVELAAIDKQAQKARKMFNDAQKMPDGDAKAKAIQGAMDTLAEARDKLSEMGDLPQYRGEDFDQVFGPKLDKMTQELKTYRDAKAKAMAGQR